MKNVKNQKKDSVKSYLKRLILMLFFIALGVITIIFNIFVFLCCLC